MCLAGWWRSTCSSLTRIGRRWRSAPQPLIEPASHSPWSYACARILRSNGMGPPWEHRRSQSGELPDELFRVGVQFEDGSKATTLDTGLSGTFLGPHGRVVDYGSGGSIDEVEGDEPEEQKSRTAPSSCHKVAGEECPVGRRRCGCGRCRPRALDLRLRMAGSRNRADPHRPGRRLDP